MTDNKTLPDSSKGGSQPSTKALQEQARPYAQAALNRLFEIVSQEPNEKNQSNIIGAAKILLAKVMPDLKSTELTDPDGKPVSFRVVIDTLNKETKSE